MATRVVPIALLAHYQQRATTLCYCLKITRPFDGVSKGYTSHDKDVVQDGFTYEAGLEVSSIQTTSGYVVGNFEVQIFPDEELTADDLIAGKWNKAYYTIGIVNWRDPSMGRDIIKAGYTGESDINDQGFYKLEFRGLMQAYQQPLGHVTQKTCRWELGDEFCGVDLTPWTFTGTVTTVVTQHAFLSTDLTQEDFFFSEGRIKFTSGANTGYEFKVKQSLSTGSVILSSGTPYAMVIGDEFEIIAGCQKRLLEDCKAKYDNVYNFGGEPHVPGGDKLMADPDVQG